MHWPQLLTFCINKVIETSVIIIGYYFLVSKKLKLDCWKYLLELLNESRNKNALTHSLSKHYSQHEWFRVYFDCWVWWLDKKLVKLKCGKPVAWRSCSNIEWKSSHRTYLNIIELLFLLCLQRRSVHLKSLVFSS